MRNLQAHKTNNHQVAVLIPHYNDISGLNLSLSSLATENADVIIVDDGSTTPPSKKLLEANHPYLKSLHVIFLANNIGIAGALNTGLAYASEVEYIARLDCGDESLPERLHHQADYLDKNASCHLVGSWAEARNAGTLHSETIRLPGTQHDILSAMYRYNAICHPSVMFRRRTAIALGGYPTNYPAAEDYALFFKFARHYSVANIEQVYLRRHSSESSISMTQSSAQIVSSIRIIIRNARPGHILTACSGVTVASARLMLGRDRVAALKRVFFSKKNVPSENIPHIERSL